MSNYLTREAECQHGVTGKQLDESTYELVVGDHFNQVLSLCP